MRFVSLGAGDFSIDPSRSGELEGIMNNALATSTAMIAGLEAACAALRSSQEPSTRSLQSRAAFLCRQAWSHPEHGAEIAALDGLVVTFEGIATGGV